MIKLFICLVVAFTALTSAHRFSYYDDYYNDNGDHYYELGDYRDDYRSRRLYNFQGSGGDPPPPGQTHPDRDKSHKWQQGPGHHPKRPLRGRADGDGDPPPPGQTHPDRDKSHKWQKGPGYHPKQGKKTKGRARMLDYYDNYDYPDYHDYRY